MMRKLAAVRRLGRSFGGLALASALLGVPPAMAGPCDSAEHRAFDFWLGEWQVYTPDGKLAGTNVIAREYDGCVLHERYTTARKYSGESLNIYDAQRRVWHQTWVDTTGTLLLLEGGPRDGSMVLEGRTLAEDGKTLVHRISWTPSPDGSVRQHWETRKDDGPWTTAFDGHYRRKAP
jgi:hypothetical protein